MVVEGALQVLELVAAEIQCTCGIISGNIGRHLRACNSTRHFDSTSLLPGDSLDSVRHLAHSDDQDGRRQSTIRDTPYTDMEYRVHAHIDDTHLLLPTCHVMSKQG